MAEPDVEAAAVANGSGLPEDGGVETVPENKGGEEMKGSEERRGGEEKKGGEDKKDGEQNGVRREEDGEGGKEEKRTEDVDMTEAVDVKDEKKAGKGEGEEEEREKPDRDNDVKEEKDSGDAEKKVDENKGVEVSKKKRARGQKAGEKRDKKEKKESGTKVKESPRTPAAIERPVRERKTVERLVEVIEKEPNKGFLIEKGRGTPIKDIPNVAYKLARKKPADLKLLHQTLFGRRGKAVNYKNHILQFSGFAWHENDEKQRAKVKEKLDKYVKDTLLDVCDLFDIPVSKATTKKEDLVVKLLDFMAAPHATSEVILAEKDQQSSKSRKRKRVAKGIASKSMGVTPAKQSRKKQTKGESTPNMEGKRAEETEEEDEEDENDNENGVPGKDEAHKHSDSDEKENESEEAAEEDEYNEHTKKGKQEMKRSSKRGSARKEKMKVVTSRKKAPLTTAKSPSKSSFSKHPDEESNDVGTKVFSRKRKNVDAPKKKSSPKPDKKERATGKKMYTGKGKSEEAKQSVPSKEELRKTICEILKEVDFNTATFTDILKQLATRYKMDLTPRKSAIKLMIQEELTKLADEAEENEDDEVEEDAEKGDDPKPTGKELEA